MMETIVRPEIEDATDTHLGGPWVVILYNDDYHSFDQVILQLQKATGCDLNTAVAITAEAHNSGRAIAYTGTQEECERVAGVLRQIRLQVETDRA
jgi:ATP-dependent Clp protease adaptor protein ClpS